VCNGNIPGNLMQRMENTFAQKTSAEKGGGGYPKI